MRGGYNRLFFILNIPFIIKYNNMETDLWHTINKVLRGLYMCCDFSLELKGKLVSKVTVEHDLLELTEADEAVSVRVGLDESLVDNLL